jgi:acyl transferase domain-containing protein
VGETANRRQNIEINPDNLVIAVFVFEYALAKLWMSWGLHPQAMYGTGIGEYVAACLAEVFSLEDALALVITHGLRLMESRNGAKLPGQLQVNRAGSSKASLYSVPGMIPGNPMKIFAS